MTRPTRSRCCAATRRPDVLQQLPGRRGCVSYLGRWGCTSSRWLGGPDRVLVTRDGRFVYVVGWFEIVGFRRAHSSGALTPLRGPASCIRVRDWPGACARFSKIGRTTTSS